MSRGQDNGTGYDCEHAARGETDDYDTQCGATGWGVLEVKSYHQKDSKPYRQ
jgi:hypothetical protein